MNETKIYLVKFKNIDNVIYIGNTHLDLNKRLQKHKYHTCKLYQYVQKNNINWNDVYIELYENFKYDKRKEYENRETEVIDTFLKDNNYIVINSSKTGGSPTKQIIQELNYYLIEKLKNIINQNIIQYNIINQDYTQYENYIEEGKNINKKEKAKSYAKKNYYENRDTKLKQMKEYRDKNKNNEKKKFICECGNSCLLRNKSIHLKSLHHIAFINQN